MIETKLIEIRDDGTMIPALAIRVFATSSPGDYLLRRGGWQSGGFGVYLFPLNCSAGVQYDPYNWPTRSRTYHVAHEWIKSNWDRLGDGSVVCVEHILGERDTPKVSENSEVPA